MSETKTNTYQGIIAFQKEHSSALIGELADLDNYMHDNPDLVTPDLVKRHIMLQVLSIQATNLVNAFMDTLQKNEDTA